MRKRIVCVALLISVMFISAFALFGCNADTGNFRLIVPEKWELEVGDSRSVDYAFADTVTDRRLEWSVSPKSKATVDVWGRVTALKPGTAWVKAKNSLGEKATVKLKIVKQSKSKGTPAKIVNYQGEAVTLGDNYQKLVSYYAHGHADIPDFVAGITDYTQYQRAVTADNAVWTIESYGVLRYDQNATNSRDIYQRFMGDRYLYKKDAPVLAIAADGENGIWTIMEEGVTHIQMVRMSGIEKAIMMSEATETYVQRRGMVSEAAYINGEWKPRETDNDGLWTSMYAAGELMRYSVLKNSSVATDEQKEAARRSAYISTEAVLLLSNITMRQGTVDAYIRYQPNAMYDPANGRYLSEVALKEGGDYSLNIPDVSPAAAFEYAYNKYMQTGESSYFLQENYLKPFTESDWADPRAVEEQFAKRTRNLEGYVSRTYSFREENNPVDGYIYWSFNGDGTATGVSTKTENQLGYYLNGENLRGVVVDASGTIPQRLWNDLIGEGYKIDDIVYKGDTSSDELIGHLFLYKIAFDIIGSEDPEIKEIIASTMDRLAQHITDNSYMMVDGSGQPGTWSKFNRAFFYNSSQLGGAPLTAAVALSLFKVAHYVTGYEKWNNEYMMAALDPAYEYAKIMAQYAQQCYMVLQLTVEREFSNFIDNPKFINSVKSQLKFGSPLAEMLTRLFLNYSDEEMAMLAFYILFQTEDNAELLNYYRSAIDQWWISIKYSENPLWYYIYQLAYPGQEVKDAYGNNVLETAAWSLSRHPIDLRKLSASSQLRDDIAEINLKGIGINDGYPLSYDCADGKLDMSGAMAYINLLGPAAKLKWAVAAPDERSLHKYNGPTYDLHGNYNPNHMEGATTYTLPFWMGMYHNMLKDIG
ncbi:MAG: Ig-like domain-containing protein [Clostridiales bacterium]|nr:Ig-like domain-containing protein [Clostridiales bacterium]